jgi:hypothetical protein
MGSRWAVGLHDIARNHIRRTNFGVGCVSRRVCSLRLDIANKDLLVRFHIVQSACDGRLVGVSAQLEKEKEQVYCTHWIRAEVDLCHILFAEMTDHRSHSIQRVSPGVSESASPNLSTQNPTSISEGLWKILSLS